MSYSDSTVNAIVDAVVHWWNTNANDDKRHEIRRHLLSQYPHLATTHEYDANIPGWKGWIEMPRIGTVAFVPDDGGPPFVEW